MKEGYVAVLDSGVGGLSVLKELIKVIPNGKFLYFGDNLNAPYGNKSISELKYITIKNLDYIKQYNICALVIGCNTLSLNLLPFISDYINLPTFGVFPPVEKFLVKGEKVLLLSTISSAKKYLPSKNFHVVGLKNLVSDIESNLFDLKNVNIEKNLILSSGKFCDEKGYYDRVILGCTHYEFVKNQILNHFCPRNYGSGAKLTADNLKKYFKKTKSLENHKRFELLFIGENAKFNEKFWVLSGQNA